MALSEDQKYELEEMIDSSGGLSDVMEALEEICYLKVEHLQSDWQDESAAKSWERDAKVIDRIIPKLEN